MNIDLEDLKENYTGKKSMQKNKKGLSGGVRYGPPPERGPNPQGLKNGGCPHREIGAKSDIKGIKNIQTSGKKFIGVR